MKATTTIKFEITNWHIQYAIQSLMELRDLNPSSAVYSEKISKTSIEKTIKEYFHGEGYNIWNYSHIDEYKQEAEDMARKLYPEFY